MTQELKLFQSQFANNPRLTHLNNAGLAPITQVACDKIKYWADRFYQEGYFTDADYMADVLSSRHALANLIGCQKDEIAWFQSAAGAINQFAMGIGLRPGDQVLMWDQEYSSHLYPWKKACDLSKAQLVLLESEKYLSTPTEKYLEALTDKVRVAAFSWVQFSTGARMDIEAVIKECKRRGITIFVDVAQGLGIHPCQLWQWGVDAVAGSSHKWLLSPVGVGYLAIRKELGLKMAPHTIGAYTYGTCDDPSDFECLPKLDATKFEPGSKQVLEITALGASCELILKVGVQTIEKEALRLAKILRDGISKRSFEILNPVESKDRSPFINFRGQTDLQTNTIEEKLRAQGVCFAKRGGGIRLSTQAFNTEAQVNLVLNLL